MGTIAFSASVGQPMTATIDGRPVTVSEALAAHRALRLDPSRAEKIAARLDELRLSPSEFNRIAGPQSEKRSGAYALMAELRRAGGDLPAAPVDHDTKEPA